MGKQQPSQRQLQVGETLRHVLAEILSRTDWYQTHLVGKHISISEIRLSSDLKIAYVYAHWLCTVETSPSDQEKKQFIEALNNNKRQLRYLMGQKIRLKSTPELRFEWDKSIDNSNKINSLIKNLSSDKLH